MGGWVVRVDVRRSPVGGALSCALEKSVSQWTRPVVAAGIAPCLCFPRALARCGVHPGNDVPGFFQSSPMQTGVLMRARRWHAGVSPHPRVDFFCHAPYMEFLSNRHIVL